MRIDLDELLSLIETKCDLCNGTGKSKYGGGFIGCRCRDGKVPTPLGQALLDFVLHHNEKRTIDAITLHTPSGDGE